MSDLKELFDSNKKWAEGVKASEPEFFANLAKGQSPPYLWIGCADSRVPPSVVCDLPPGQIFVHRNVANLVTHNDVSLQSVMQYSVQVLKVEHVIVCGHYGCGGVAAAMGDQPLGLIDNWLRNIKDVYAQSGLAADSSLDDKARADKLVEANVAAQVRNVCHTTIIQDAWHRGQKLTVHGLVYSLEEGLLKDLDLSVSSADQLSDVYQMSASSS